MTEEIGNYNILKKIGAGGMAQVYLAVHRDVPNLKVVLKVLSDRRLVNRFKQEADKLALLDGHAHICQIKHFFNHGDDIVIAMEFIDGQTLEERIKANGRLGEAESLEIVAGVLETLGFAHQKDVYHRDIKPGNIMIDKNGQVKIIDFGIAKGESDPNLTVTGSSCGTPSYMPPEQFNPSGAINYALADVYAVGTTLYYMTTGQLPFAGDNIFALRDAKLFNDPTPPCKLNPEISPELETIILKAIEKEPDNRYTSVVQMAEAIRGLQDKTGVSKPRRETATPITRDAPGGEAPRPKKKTVMIAAGIVLVGAIIIVLGINWLSGEDRAALSPPRLWSPASAATVATAKPEFFWSSTGPGFRYDLEIANDTTFIGAELFPELTDTFYLPIAGFPDGLYHWRVRTVDSEGRKSGWSSPAIITIALPAESQAVGRLVLSIRPSGDLYIDDQLIRRNASNYDAGIPAGEHQVRVENSASRQKQLGKQAVITAGEATELDFDFSMPPPASTENYGEVRVGSRPLFGAAVFIDGILQDRRTNAAFRVETGRHIIKGVLTLEGKEMEKIDTVMVESGGVHKITFDFEQ